MKLRLPTWDLQRLTNLYQAMRPKSQALSESRALENKTLTELEEVRQQLKVRGRPPSHCASKRESHWASHGDSCRVAWTPVTLM